MEPENFKKGDIIIKQGDSGTKYYVMMKGSVLIHISSEGLLPNSKLNTTKLIQINDQSNGK
jgi:CRP-like cAMP-binding protein